ncbi:MAG: IS1380 family transposase [Candidatus Acidiferrales bacterium]
MVAKFDQQQGSSDGGAILLKAAERRLGLTSALAVGLRDDRQPGKVRHELHELITQRVMALALGYEDANDAARLASDPIHKLLVGRDPVDGEDLASQPTLSRFENAPDRKELLRMTEALADSVIERHRKRLHGRARGITIDMDPTDDPTHGQQQFTFFNRHYDSYCYLPMVCFLTFNEEAEQYLVAAVLRRGNATGSVGARGILRRLMARVSNAFPQASIRVRLDGGFASPEVLDFLDCQPKVEYLVNMASNDPVTFCCTSLSV